MATELDRETFAVLGASPVFAGVAPQHLLKLLDAIGAYTRSYDKGEAVFRSGDALSVVPVVLKGCVEARMLAKDGSKQIIARFEKGDSFAEAVPVSGGTAPVEAIALEPSRILFMPVAALKRGGDSDIVALYGNILGEMTKKVRTLTSKLSILSEPRLRNRIIMYLRSLPTDASGFANIPFSRKALAEYLAVNDKALLRELHRMQDEGIIEGEGKRLKLLKDDQA